MSSCVIPGSFDPVTRGHMDLIRRAAAVFDHVTVVVMVNIRKSGVFTPEERAEMLRKACGGGGWRYGADCWRTICGRKTKEL